MNPIRLIVSDLDGTLLSAEHTLPESVVDAVRYCARQGVQFTVATGRPYITAKSIIDKLEIKLPVILCNGAILAQPDGGAIERHGISTAAVADLLLAAHRSGLEVLLFREDEVHTLGRGVAVDEYERKEQVACRPIRPERLGDYADEMDKAILLGSVTESRSLFTAFARRSSSLQASVSLFQSETNYLELVPGQASKGAALRQLAARAGIPLQQVMAIGNQFNDLPMLEAAGIGVAVANSPTELKQAADYVCQSSYSEGVLEAMRYYIMNGGINHGEKNSSCRPSRLSAEVPGEHPGRLSGRPELEF